MNQKVFRFLIVLGSLLLSVGLVELLFRLYFAFNMSYPVEMWKYHRDLKLPTSDPRSHIHRKSAQSELMGVMISTNNYGFRGADIIESEDISKSFVMLGDSLTLGWGVSEKDTFCKRIETTTKKKCINAGVGNYNLEQIIENYKQNPLFLRASKIVYVFYINDAEPVQNEFALDFCFNSLACVMTLNSSRSLLRDHDYKKYYDKFYEDENWIKFENSLKELIRVVGGERLTVVLLPEFRNVNARPFLRQHQKISYFLDQQNVKNLDLIYFPEATSQDEYWVSHDDPHPNAIAHKKIADMILEKVKF